MGIFGKSRPQGVEVTALDLCKPEYLGRAVLDVPEGDVAWRQARRNLGHNPQVKSCGYLADGEGGEPTVYLELTGWKRPGNYCLRPDDVITLED